MLNVISKQTLNTLSNEARLSPRLRKNLNFHQNNESQCHRLLNALEPGTYVQPHCHLSAEKEETLLVLSGRIGVVIFNNVGDVIQTYLLSPTTETEALAFGITIPVGTFHSMVALESNSVFFEAKAGPYVAIVQEEKAHWAPNEGDQNVSVYLKKMIDLFS